MKDVPNNILFCFSPPLDVDLYLVGVRENTMILKYVVNPLLLHERFVVDHIKNNTTHRELEILTEEKRVLVHLDGFRKMKKLLNVVLPRGLIFNNGDVELDMILT